MVVLLALLVGNARGIEPIEPIIPQGLDQLVELALQRDPEAAALDLDLDAALAKRSTAGRLPDVQWMLGVQAVGAMPSSPDPTMGMIGLAQMFSMPSAYRAPRARAALDARWAEGEQARLAADVKQVLWESAARLKAYRSQALHLDTQITAAGAALAFGRARYAAGAGNTPAVIRPQSGQPPTSSVTVPVVRQPNSPAEGMSGMGTAPNMGASPPAGVETMGMQRGQPMSQGKDEMAEMGDDMPGGMKSSMRGEGLASLLRLDAEVGRAHAERESLRARQAGEFARLALILGDAAARVVVAEPGRFLGALSESRPQPEHTLAATSTAMAAADVEVARAGRLPTFMVSADLRVMPEGMIDGVDAKLGVTVPIWSGSAARVDAALLASRAAALRSEAVDRDLADAVVAANAERSAAEARLSALTEIALPRARAAWQATLAVWSAGSGEASDLVSTWQTELGVAREAVDAELDHELALARLARLEGR